MAHVLVRNWGTLVLQGAIAILFGLMILVAPAATLLTLAFLFAAFAIADGILALISIFLPEQDASRWLLAIYGIVGIGIGVLVFLSPGISVLTFLYLVAIWAFVIGIFRVATAITLRREIEGEWLLLISGLVSVVFGFVVLFLPGGLTGLLMTFAFYLIIQGAILVATGLRLRRHRVERMERGPGGPGPTTEGGRAPG